MHALCIFVFRGLAIRMVYLYNDVESKYTILVGNPRFAPVQRN